MSAHRRGHLEGVTLYPLKSLLPHVIGGKAYKPETDLRSVTENRALVIDGEA